MGPKQAPTPPQPQIQPVYIQSPAPQVASNAQQDIQAAQPLIHYGEAQYNQQLPFIRTAARDDIANRFGSAENAGGTGSYLLGQQMGQLGQNLAQLEGQATTAGAQGALQGLQQNMLNTMSNSQARPFAGLYSNEGQAQAINNLAQSLVGSFGGRQDPNSMYNNSGNGQGMNMYGMSGQMSPYGYGMMPGMGMPYGMNPGMGPTPYYSQ